VLKPFLRCTFFFAVALVMAGAAFGQDWFRISTGLGVEKPRVAVADFAPRGIQRRGTLPFSRRWFATIWDSAEFWNWRARVFIRSSSRAFLRNCATRPGQIRR